jgi:hypothetical protein
MFLFCHQESFTAQLISAADIGMGQFDPAANNLKSERSEMKGEIRICCGVLDPVKGESQLSGKVRYKHSTLQVLHKKITIKVHLELEAELFDRLIRVEKYTIYGISIDTISVNSGSKLLIDKSYGVLNRPDLNVCVQYLITPFSIKIMRVRLLRLYE